MFHTFQYETSQEVLQDVYDGYIDSACAYFNPDGKVRQVKKTSLNTAFDLML